MQPSAERERRLAMEAATRVLYEHRRATDTARARRAWDDLTDAERYAEVERARHAVESAAILDRAAFPAAAPVSPETAGGGPDYAAASRELYRWRWPSDPEMEQYGPSWEKPGDEAARKIVDAALSAAPSVPAGDDRKTESNRHAVPAGGDGLRDLLTSDEAVEAAVLVLGERVATPNITALDVLTAVAARLSSTPKEPRKARVGETVSFGDEDEHIEIDPVTPVRVVGGDYAGAVGFYSSRCSVTGGHFVDLDRDPAASVATVEVCRPPLHREEAGMAMLTVEPGGRRYCVVCGRRMLRGIPAFCCLGPIQGAARLSSQQPEADRR